MTRSRTTLFIVLGILAVVLLMYGRPPKAASAGNILRISSESPPDYLDPGMSYMVVSWQTMVNVYNGLLTYRKTDGAEGTQIVPDLATSMPTIGDAGKTFSFTMRRGIKWGPPLTREVLPSDIKYAIERDFMMASPGSGFFLNIEGAEEFAGKKAKTIAGIVIDDNARTIVFHLKRPDATFLNVLALPFSFAVPKGTPPKDQSNAGFIPATGPYMFTKYEPARRIELRRNPNFRSWSPEVPDGNVDGIQIQLGVSTENAVTLIKRGKIDFMFGSVPRSKLPMLIKDPKLSKQIHTEKLPSTSYIYMNTTVPPFNSRKARQAINWAIDRRAMVKLTGGLGTPTETILPPMMPGFNDHKLYPKPDMDKARQLLAESGVKPGKIDVWCRTNEPNPTLAVYLQNVLNQLGFAAAVKCVDSSSYFTLVGNEKTKALIGLGNWSQDYPEGSNFIDVLLNGERITPEHNNNLAWYRGADKEIAAANRLMDPAARAKAWGAVDEQIVNDAAWAPYMHGIAYVFVSERLDNFVSHPVYEMLFMKVKLKGEKPHPAVAGDSAVVGGGAPQPSATARYAPPGPDSAFEEMPFAGFDLDADTPLPGDAAVAPAHRDRTPFIHSRPELPA